MPNQPDPDKAHLSLRVPRTLLARVKRLAAKKGQTVTDYVTELIFSEVKDVQLSSEDYEKIAQATREAERRLGKPRHKNPARSQKAGGEESAKGG